MKCKLLLGLRGVVFMALRDHLTERKETMFAKWTDAMVREYFDTHWNVTLHEMCALSGRTKADIKQVLMGK